MIAAPADTKTMDRFGFGPFANPYLALRLAHGSDMPADWVRNLPCPVLGLGDASHPAATFCDLVTDSAEDLARIAANIELAPMAATTLVQVLRITAEMPAADALCVESLAYAALQGGAENRAWLAARTHPARIEETEGSAVLVHRASATLTLTLNRPAARNAINLALRDALAKALALAALDTTIGEIHLHGAGKCFCTGGAMEDFGAAPDQATAHAVRCTAGPAFRLAAIAGRATAHVHGACIGAGAELAALCGTVIARPNSFFQLPEIRFGLIPGSGGTVSISRRIGRQRAAYLMLSARRIGARTALAWGLVDRLEDTRPGQTLPNEHLPSTTGTNASSGCVVETSV